MTSKNPTYVQILDGKQILIAPEATGQMPSELPIIIKEYSDGIDIQQTGDTVYLPMSALRDLEKIIATIRRKYYSNKP